MSVNIFAKSKSLAFLRSPILFVFLFLLLLSLLACDGTTVKTKVTLATTTSVNDSGLLDYLKPVLEKDTGIDLNIVAQGTGQAIKTGENGDADVLFVHSKKDEEAFVSNDFGLKRIEVMKIIGG